MSGRRGGTRRRATRKPVIVVAGEDSNDRKCLALLIEALCPGARGRCVEISDPVRLHGATGANLARRVAAIVAKARARSERENADIAAIFVHEDYDGIDSEKCDAARRKVQAALEAGVGTAHYVLATWEIEAWLIMFPDALSATVRSWSLPRKYRGKDTGRISDPKKVLIRELSASGRTYRESDAPRIVEKAIELALLDKPSGSNNSWSELGKRISTMCEAIAGVTG